MNSEQQIIAIAEVCGWKPSSPKGKWCHPANWSLAKNGAYGVWVGQDSLPNYPGDLNAMHEAEKKLNHTQRQKFITELYLIVGRPNSPVFASAVQRAEAFLKTLNLWIE